MRPVAWLLIVILLAPDASAQNTAAPASATQPSSSTSASDPSAGDTVQLNLPVSLDRIRKELGREPAISIQSIRDQPTFRIEIQERNRLQDLLLTLDFSAGPTPAGGIYAAEMQRVMFPAVSNPLRQPLAAFNQTELLTVISETLAGTYLAKKVAGAVTSAERSAAQEAARAELHRAIMQYCAGQPNNGAGIAICTNSEQ
jgi:hypothetical protein